MAYISPKPLKRGVSYLNKAFNELLAYVEQTKVIPQSGWTETPLGLIPPNAAPSTPAADSLIVSIHSDGKLTQKEGTMPDTTVGSSWNGVPTLLASTGVTYTDGDVVVAKIQYAALDTADELTDWETTAIDFLVYAPGSIPADSLPVWNSGTTTWTTSAGTYYFTWATTNSDTGAVSFSETGPCRIVYCGSTDIRVIT